MAKKSKGRSATARMGTLPGFQQTMKGDSLFGIDGRMADIANAAAAEYERQNPGYSIEAISTLAARASGTRNHPEGWAVDVSITGPNGRLRNAKDARTFREYEKFAQLARAYQQQNYPELDGTFRYGGYFQQGVPFDAMHIDANPKRAGAMANGTWENGLDPDAARRLNRMSGTNLPYSAISQGMSTGVGRLPAEAPRPTPRPDPAATRLAEAYAAGGRRSYGKSAPAGDFSGPDVRGLARGYGDLAKSLQTAGARTGSGGVVAPSPLSPVRAAQGVRDIRARQDVNAAAAAARRNRTTTAPTTSAAAPRRAVDVAQHGSFGLDPGVAALTASVARNLAPLGRLPARPSMFTPATVAGTSTPTAVAGASRMAPGAGLTPQQALTQAATLLRPTASVASNFPARPAGTPSGMPPAATGRLPGEAPRPSPRPTASIASSLPATTGAVPTARPSMTTSAFPGRPAGTPAGMPAASRFQDVTTAVPTARPALSNVATPAQTAAAYAGYPDEASRAAVKSGYKYGDYTVADRPIKEVTSIEEAPTAPRQQSSVKAGGFPPAPPSGTFPKAPPAYDPAHPPGVMGKIGDLAQRYGPGLAVKALGISNPLVGLGATLLGMSLNEAKPGQIFGNPFAGLAKTAKAMFASAPQTYQGPRTTYGTGLNAISDVLGGSTPVGATAYSRSTPGYRVTNVGNNTVEKVNQYGFRSYEQVKPGLTAAKKTSQSKAGGGRSLSPAADKARSEGKGGLY